MENNNKIPLKHAEMSVHRFNDMAIPHHLGLLNNHRINIEKSLALGDWNKIRKEEINAMRVIKQIKNLLVEMDGLRDKLPTHEDQLQFDAMLEVGKQKAFASMKQYMELQLKSSGSNMLRKRNSSTGMYISDEDDDDDVNNMENNAVEIGNTRAHQRSLPQIEVDFEQQEYQLAQRQACLDELEALQHEIRDLNGMFHNMSDLVQVQGESVQAIAENAEEALENVQAGEQNLRRALGYKKAMYPVVGALIGTCVGGPIGLVAGLKAGSLAAVGCGLLGFTGGSVLKGNPTIMQGGIIEEQEQQQYNNETTNTMTTTTTTGSMALVSQQE